MTQSVPILGLSITSAGAIARGRGVGFNGAQIAAANAKVMGIARVAATAAGQDVTVDVCGTTICEAGAPITLGATLVMDAQGRVVPGAVMAVAAGATQMTSTAANGAAVLTGADTPSFAVGDAMQAATAAGQFIEVLLRR